MVLSILQGEQASDRADTIVHVFHMKLEELLKDMQSKKIFGEILAILYSVEFQKRGLPHVHILLWLDKKQYEITAYIIDTWISVEISNPYVEKKMKVVYA